MRPERDPPAVLIVATPKDDHAAAVSAALRERGVRVESLDLAEIPSSARITARLGSGPLRAVLERSGSPPLDLAAVGSVWLRRISGPAPRGIRDEADWRFAQSESWNLLVGLAQALVGARWVNSPAAAAIMDSGWGKIRQLEAARSVGLEIPETVATNDPAAARAFLDDRPRSIYKPFAAIERGGSCLFTREVDDDIRSRLDAVALAPCLFQGYVEKRVELRATVVGDRVFACEIRSQGFEDARVDWRVRYKELPRAPHDLPPDVARRLVALHRELGLAFGTSDMIVTPDGRYVFLETNQQGQWIWTADAFPAGALLGAVCDLLSPETKSNSPHCKNEREALPALR